MASLSTLSTIDHALGCPFGSTDEGLAIEFIGSAKARDDAISEFIQAWARSGSEPFRIRRAK